MKKLLLALVAALSLFYGCKQAADNTFTSLPPQKGAIRITGAYALYPLMQTWIREFEKTHPGISFELTAIGSGGGIDELLAGNCDLAMVSSDLEAGKDTLIWITPVAALAVVPVTSSQNPYLDQIRKKGITREELMNLFTGQGPTWGDLYGKPGKDPVHVYVRSDKSGATDVIVRYLMLERGEIRGQGENGEDQLIKAVQSDPLAIGYCNFIYSIDPQTMAFTSGLTVIPIDANENGKMEFRESFYDSASHLQRAMWSGKYPYSLKRNLSLACKGLPATKEVAEFLEYCLTYGQSMVAKEGYVELHNSEIQCRITLLEDLLKPQIREKY